jgi:hypothetical protein
MRQQGGDFHGLLALFIGTIAKTQNYSNKNRHPKEEMLKKNSFRFVRTMKSGIRDALAPAVSIMES